MASNNNRKRAFADVVSIDAWHEGFSEDRPAVDLYADVAFGTARIGGEGESPVRFRLRIKRAEIVVVLPQMEPVSVDKASVARGTAQLEGKVTQVVEKSSQASGKAKLNASLSPKGFKGEVAVGALAASNAATSEKIEVSGDAQLMTVMQSKTPDGHYRWIVMPRSTPALDGRPWDAVKQPRLRLVDRRANKARGIPPTVRVEVWCKREDLIIDDLEIKNESLWSSVKRRAGFRNRMAAAESYIRDRLLAEGLEVQNLDDIFGHLTLGSTTAEAS